jgi:adenosylmethionine-8-amino-7-oxononanoate aminotransferase
MTAIDKLLDWDERHLVHQHYPIGQNKRVTFEKAEGVRLQDAQGKEYIDFSSHLTCINLGYGHSELVAVSAEQMKKLSYGTIFLGFSHRPSIECCIKLAEITPEGLDHFCLTSGGSQSIEQASNFARLYWSNRGSVKHKIISLYGSFHGVSSGALSATGTGKGTYWKGMTSLPGYIHIPPFYCYRCMYGKEYPQCGTQCAKHLAEVIEQEGPETVAAFIAEPVIGAGGMIPPPREYWPMVREICTDYDVLLVVDEIMTGFCRTGKMFAVEHWEIKPDIMTVAKGMPRGSQAPTSLWQLWLSMTASFRA